MKRIARSAIARRIKPWKNSAAKTRFAITWRALYELYAPVMAREQIIDHWLKKGYDLGKRRYFEDAIKCFDAALMLNAQDPLAWKGKGLALQALRRDAEAVSALARARDLGLPIDLGSLQG